MPMFYWDTVVDGIDVPDDPQVDDYFVQATLPVNPGDEYYTEANWASVPPRLVPLGAIYIEQTHVTRSGVIHHLHNYSPDSGMLPWITLYQGSYYLHDGTHRAYVAALRGEDFLEAHVIDLRDGGPYHG